MYFFGGFWSVYLSGRMYIAASSCFVPVLRSTWYTSDSGWFGSKIVLSLIQSQCRKCSSPVRPSPIDWKPSAVAAAGSLHFGSVLIVETSSCFATFACCFVTPLTPVRSMRLGVDDAGLRVLERVGERDLPVAARGVRRRAQPWCGPAGTASTCTASAAASCRRRAAPATVAVPAVTSEMAKNEAMRRRVSRTEIPPGSVAPAIVGANCTRCAVAPGRRSLALGPALGLLLLLPGPHPGERLARVDVGHRPGLGVAERPGEPLPARRGLAQALARGWRGGSGPSPRRSRAAPGGGRRRPRDP